MYDIVIRGGTVVDGRGGEPFLADVAIIKDRIVAVGANLDAGAQEVDAQGFIVTPGFVDLHTHYDAQLNWDPILEPSANHGVTTVVIGNCGVGFAPARAADRRWLLEVMEEVEEIPVEVMEAGMTWKWETFPQFLDAVEAMPHSIDIVTQVPALALRAYVMGERGMRDEPATPADLAAMADLAVEALEAGAVGLALSRNDAHRLANGDLIPGSFPPPNELVAMASALSRVKDRQIQFLGLLADWEGDLPIMRDMARASGSPVHFLMSDTNWQAKLAGIEQARAEGLHLVGHIPPRPVGNLLSWQGQRNPFMDRPSIKAIVDLPWEERRTRLADSAFKAKVLSEDNGGAEARLSLHGQRVYHAFDGMFEVGGTPNYEPDATTDSIAARAAAAGQEVQSYAYDVLNRNAGEGMIYMALANYRAGNLDDVGTIMRHPGTVVSLSDAGAHCTRVIDATLPTFMMIHWARDRSRGATMPLAEVIRLCTHDAAMAYGLGDRGVISPGYLADINIIDFDRLALEQPYLAQDFPVGGMRILQKAQGYIATIKSGQVTFRNGAHVGAFPGSLVRGPRHQPQPVAL